MSDLLQDLESYFTSNGNTTKLFRDTMLDLPDEAIALYEYTGSSFQSQIAGAERPVQVVVRHKSATSAKDKARELYKLLMSDNGIIYLTSDRWTVASLKQPPYKLRVDESGRVYYCFNVYFTTYID